MNDKWNELSPNPIDDIRRGRETIKGHVGYLPLPRMAVSFEKRSELVKAWKEWEKNKYAIIIMS